MQTSAMKTCFQIAECSFIFCKDYANERNENLFSDCRVQLYLLQRYTFLLKQQLIGSQLTLFGNQIDRKSCWMFWKQIQKSLVKFTIQNSYFQRFKFCVNLWHLCNFSECIGFDLWLTGSKSFVLSPYILPTALSAKYNYFKLCWHLWHLPATELATKGLHRELARILHYPSVKAESYKTMTINELAESWGSRQSNKSE